MAVVIQVLRDQATIENWKWTSFNRSLEKNLNAFTAIADVYNSDPYPDLTLAKQAVERLGGEIIKQDSPPKAIEGMIY